MLPPLVQRRVYGKRFDLCALGLLNDYQIGLIQKEELQEAIGEISLSNYIAARKSFHQKYGYYPIKVPVYGLDGLDILRFEKGGSYNDQC